MKKIQFFCICFSSFFVGFSQTNTDATTKKLESLYKSSQFPGFAVAIVSEKGIIYQNAFGYSDLENKTPYTTTSVQNIASISKTFIGVAIMKCVDLGYFTLDTDINTIIPFTVNNPNRKTDVIKIKHLVTHTSGILDNEEVYSKSFYFNQYSDKKSPLYNSFAQLATIENRDDIALSVFFKNYFSENGTYYQTSNFSKEIVGTEYNYSNIAAGLAAFLVEIKSGMPFDLFCKKYIFEPLKMDNTSFTFTDAIAQNHVKLYNSNNQFYPLYSEITYPDGSLKSTIEDLSKYLIEMILGYNGNASLLSPNSFKTLFEKQFSEDNLPKNNDPKEPNSGVFWRYRKNGLIGHTGSDVGVATFMFFNPETGTGRIFLTNSEIENSFDGTANKKLIEQFSTIWKVLE